MKEKEKKPNPLNKVLARLHALKEQDPEALALIDQDQAYSRKELWDLIEKQEALLPDEPVFGVLMEHGIHQIVSILAILKKGAAYVPVEPFFPKKRIEYMMKEAGVKTVLSDDELRVIQMDLTPLFPLQNAITFAKEEGEKETERPELPENLAYILYTSGTTGKPKGVCITTENLDHYIDAFAAEFHPQKGDIMLQHSVCSFDIFVEEVFGSLANGAALAIPDAKTKEEINLLLDYIEEKQITMLSGFPYLLQEINESKRLPGSLRLLISGGDVLRDHHIDWLKDKVQVYNTYGPSETTVCASYFPIQDSKPLKDGTYPIGKPIKDVKIFLLDQDLNPVSSGKVGEIVIAGAGVGAGYVNAKLNDSFTHYQGQRAYRSGDLGYEKDGNLVFFSRMDDQIMIYGKRVELDEVQNVLMQSGLVSDGVIRVESREDKTNFMICYYVGKTEEKEIRAYFQNYLPDYMIPLYYVQMDQIPRNANGKVDANLLPSYNDQTRIRYASVDQIGLFLKLREKILTENYEIERWNPDYFKSQEGRQVLENNQAFVLEAMKEHRFYNLFAWDKEKVVACAGLVLYQELPTPDNVTGWCGYLVNIYTSPGYRNLGLATRMVRELIEKAREHQAGKIYLESTREAIKFYQDLGFKEMKDFFRLED